MQVVCSDFLEWNLLQDSKALHPVQETGRRTDQKGMSRLREEEAMIQMDNEFTFNAKDYKIHLAKGSDGCYYLIIDGEKKEAYNLGTNHRKAKSKYFGILRKAVQ